MKDHLRKLELRISDNKNELITHLQAHINVSNENGSEIFKFAASNEETTNAEIISPTEGLNDTVLNGKKKDNTEVSK